LAATTPLEDLPALDLVRFRLVPAEPVVVEEEELEELEALGDETLSPPLRRALDIFAGGV